MPLNSFLSMIDQLAHAPEEAKGPIADAIKERFEREHTVLALDMSGFSFSVRREGILPHLCKIRSIHKMAAPIIERWQGQVVKLVADNILAVFEHPGDAISAAFEMNETIARTNSGEAEERLLEVAIGIDHGPVILIPEHECFGDPVNIAYKLGEDVARAGEVLITRQASHKLQSTEGYALEPVEVSLSGVHVSAFLVKRAG